MRKASYVACRPLGFIVEPSIPRWEVTTLNLRSVLGHPDKFFEYHEGSGTLKPSRLRDIYHTPGGLVVTTNQRNFRDCVSFFDDEIMHQSSVNNHFQSNDLRVIHTR